MKIAVTAASGKLGGAIIKQLKLEIGEENVVGLARTPENAQSLGVEIRKGDYNNSKDLTNSLNGINAVLIVSGMDAPEKRIKQHRNIINAAKSNGVDKIVYTSIIGDEGKTTFAPIIQSNRQTEEDIKNSGLDWVIGRNGLYIEPDIEYIEKYKEAGFITNCSAEGKCAYTSRKELAYAYAKMIISDIHNGKIFNLVGDPISQAELAQNLNQVFGTDIIFKHLSVNEYEADRKKELGEFLGTVIGGIYEGIRNGAYNVPSDYKKAAGRAHKSTIDMIKEFKNEM